MFSPMDSLAAKSSFLLSPISVGVLVAAAFVAVLYVRQAGSGNKTNIVEGQNPQELGKNTKNREDGEWKPVKFPYPDIPVSPLNLVEVKPIPYRPFRWGQYHVTMGIRDMPWDEWIELDSDFSSYFAIRKHRIQSQGENVIRVLPDHPGVVKSGRESAVELVHDLAHFVTKQHPEAFIATRDASGVMISVTVQPVDTVLHLPPPLVKDNSDELVLREVTHEEAEQAMKVSALLVQEDLALMVEGVDGRYYFQGGAICVPGFWRLRDKIGMPLDEIHFSGNVPQYKEKLHVSMGRFFKRLPVNKPVIRNNYSVQVVQPEELRRRVPDDMEIAPTKKNEDLIDPLELSWSRTTQGNEDDEHPAHRDEKLEGIQNAATILPSTLQFRTERQTLRRLPLSGAIVFTIRTYIAPMTELGKEEGVPARLASAVRSWPEGVRKYKGSQNYENILIEYMDKCAEEQRLAGGEAVEKTTGRGYPY